MNFFPQNSLGRRMAAMVAGTTLAVLSIAFLSFSWLERKGAVLQAKQQAMVLGEAIQWAITEGLRESQSNIAYLQEMVDKIGRLDRIDEAQILDTDLITMAQKHPDRIGEKYAGPLDPIEDAISMGMGSQKTKDGSFVWVFSLYPQMDRDRNLAGFLMVTSRSDKIPSDTLMEIADWTVRDEIADALVEIRQNREALRGLTVRLGKLEGVDHIEVVSPDGVILAHSTPDKVGMRSRGTPFVSQVFETGKTLGTGHEDSQRFERYIPLITENRFDSKVVAVAEVVFTTQMATTSTQQFVSKGLIIILALTALLSGILVYALRRSVTGRLVSLAGFSHQISQGDFKNRIKDDSPDEIGRLSRVLNAMAKNLEQGRSKLEKKLEAQKEVDQFKDNFLAIISHELRTPLTAVIGFSDAMLEGYTGAISEHQRRLLGKILDNGEQLKRLLNNILDYERIQSGRVEPTPWMASLEEIIDYCVSMIEIQAEMKRVKISKSIPFKLPPVRVDVMQIQSIITNLLTNALKFTPEGGKIEVTGRVLPAVEREVPHIEILVSDTGIGIPEEEREKVFYRFYQVQREANREFPGTGLGLALARELALVHGGWLQLRERAGWATTFSFGIPVDLEQPLHGIHLQKSTIHVPTMINGIIHLLEQEKERDLRVVFPLPPDGTPDHCVGDRAYLRAILINIIQNSVKYRHKGTAVQVRLRSDEDAMKIIVQNEGAPFSKKEMERIFGKPADRKPKEDKMDQPRFMSLGSARKILLALNGSLMIENVNEDSTESEPQGVRFSICLPQPQLVGKGGNQDVEEKNTRH